MKRGIAVLLSCVLWFALGVFFSVAVTWDADTVSMHVSSNTRKTVIEPGKEVCEKATGSPSSLEETSSTIEELASIAKQHADNAKRVNALMEAPIEVVQRSDNEMVSPN
jgi:hypothetical protein